MIAENWWKAVDYFMTEEHEKRSAANKAVRQKQKYINLGGTSSYSSACYKKNKSRLDQFHDAHTDKDGKFDSELAESQYKEYECQNEALGEEGSFSQLHPRDVSIFEKVMGPRRGHIKGIGPKPSSTSPSVVTREDEQVTPPSLTQAQVEKDKWCSDLKPPSPPSVSSGAYEDVPNCRRRSHGSGTQLWSNKSIDLHVGNNIALRRHF
ncbi:hypothetical protein QVD17_20207 [Tagetes erecta]|uniref:Uncharacterized protein n=1 Tax=Tagetes erecta TaxID=13708 RepID=A0AAD8KL38_TARER|nr:hypothetical protein QVD17_20207 [Tagetes erecta]